MGNPVNKSAPDALNENKGVIGNNVMALRVERDIIQRDLQVLQLEKQGLEQQVQATQQKFYNNLSLRDIEDMKADRDMTVPPIQSFKNTNYGFVAPVTESSDASKKAARLAGVETFQKKIKNLEDRYKEIQANIRNKTNRLEEINALLTKNENQGKGITAASMEKDRIARSRVASLLFLQNLSTTYYSMTSAPDANGVLVRNWPQFDVKSAQDLQTYRQLFGAHAASFPEFRNTNGSSKLNLQDPGDPANQGLIEGYLTLARVGAESSDIDEKVNQYTKLLTATIANRNKSATFLRQNPAPPPSDTAMSQYNASYPIAMIKTFGKTYYTPYQLGSLKECVLDHLRGKYSDSFVGIPPCTPITPEQAQKDARATVQDVTVAKGTEDYAKVTATAVTTPATDADVLAAVSDLWPSTIKKSGDAVAADNTKPGAGMVFIIDGTNFMAYTPKQETLLSLVTDLVDSLNGLILNGKATEDQKKSILLNVIAYLRTLTWVGGPLTV